MFNVLSGKALSLVAASSAITLAALMAPESVAALSVKVEARATEGPVREQKGVSPRESALRKVSPRAFGIHAYQGKPDTPARALRVACAPSWEKMNPARHVFRWRSADRSLARARSYGSERILFVFCHTPEWAAKPGVPAMVAPPKRMVYWRDFIRAFVDRYGSVIDEYEVWNEATSRYWWQGTPAQMARMTHVAAKEIRRLDPSGKVVSASIQCCNHPDWFFRFVRPHLRALRARNWPVDALAFHTYVDVTAGRSMARSAGLRTTVLRTIRRATAAARVPRRVQLWDTETNHLVRSPVSVQKAIVARTFLESVRWGFARTYWYMYTLVEDPWLGIQMMPGSPASVVFRRTWGWTEGSKVIRCQRGRLLACTYRRSGKTYQIAYTSGVRKRATLRFRGRARVCLVTEALCEQKRRRATIGFTPVRISGMRIKAS